MPIDIVSISHIKYQNCVWNCLVAWSMWKKESKYCLARSQWWLSRFECKLLCFSPYMRKPVLFYYIIYRERWNKEALCATLRHLCNDKAALGKKIWIRLTAVAAKHLPDWHKRRRFFSRTLVNLKVSDELPKKHHVSDLFNVCLFVKLISLRWWKANKGRDWQHFVTSFRRSSH